jgi:hypothetical protein
MQTNAGVCQFVNLHTFACLPKQVIRITLELIIVMSQSVSKILACQHHDTFKVEY